MPAKIVVKSGTDRGREVPIESRVATIGGHPGSEIHISGQPDAVATVRFRDDVYTVFNRSESSLVVDGEVIGRDESCPWRSGCELLLGEGGVSLELVIVGSPEPVRQSIVEEDDPLAGDGFDDEEEEAGEGTTEEKPKRTNEMIIITICVVVCGFLLIDEEKQSGPVRNTGQEFHQLVSVLLPEQQRDQFPDTSPKLPENLVSLASEAPPEEQVLFDRVREVLQEARTASRRGKTQDAVQKYQRARDLLLVLGAEDDLPIPGLRAPARGRTSADAATRSIYNEVYRFVVAEIDSMSR